MPKMPKSKKRPPIAKPKRSVKKATISKILAKQTYDPIWRGPLIDGVTQSMLSEYIVCPERFRLRVMFGLGMPDTFSPPLHYGNMFHVCEEFSKTWQAELRKYAMSLCKEFPEKQADVNKWYEVCKIQYPIYLEYWREHDIKQTEMMSEVSFRVPIVLKEGREVTMRGKWDSVFVTEDNEIFLKENKTKSEIDREKIKKRLTFDLQTMYYLAALYTHLPDPERIKGIYYNLIRRPLSGGKGTIRQKKGQSSQEYYIELADVIKRDVGTYFDRFMAEVTRMEVLEFVTHFLDPILNNLVDDWEWWLHCFPNNVPSVYDSEKRKTLFPNHTRRHYRFPYGIYSNLTEGRGMGSDLDFYLDTSNEVGLVRGKPLFPEL